MSSGVDDALGDAMRFRNVLVGLFWTRLHRGSLPRSRRNFGGAPQLLTLGVSFGRRECLAFV